MTVTKYRKYIYKILIQIASNEYISLLFCKNKKLKKNTFIYLNAHILRRTPG